MAPFAKTLATPDARNPPASIFRRSVKPTADQTAARSPPRISPLVACFSSAIALYLRIAGGVLHEHRRHGYRLHLDRVRAHDGGEPSGLRSLRRGAGVGSRRRRLGRHAGVLDPRDCFAIALCPAVCPHRPSDGAEMRNQSIAILEVEAQNRENSLRRVGCASIDTQGMRLVYIWSCLPWREPDAAVSRRVCGETQGAVREPTLCAQA